MSVEDFLVKGPKIVCFAPSLSSQFYGINRDTVSHEAIIINIVRVKAVYQSVEVKCVNDGATRQTVDCSCEKNSAVKKMLIVPNFYRDIMVKIYIYVRPRIT